MEELYKQAKEIVIAEQKVSTPFLQRNLRIGYAQAVRMMDMLEERGVIGPANGSHMREIFKK